jgi:hypothetical protein
MGRRRPFPPSLLRIANPGGSDEYDIEAELAALPSAFSTLIFPNAPAITNEVSVTDLTGLTNNMNVSGRRTVIADGVSIALTGVLTLSGTDTELELRGSAQLTGSSDGHYLFFTGTRQRLVCSSGSQVSVHVSGGSGVTDTVIWGVTQRTLGQTVVGDGENNWFAPTRLAICHCDFESDGYVRFFHNSGASRPVDCIEANSRFYGAYTTDNIVRSSNLNRAVFLDNLYHVQPGFSSHSWRSHGGSTPGAGPNTVYYARNMNVGAGIFISANPAGSSDFVSEGADIWWLDNSLYPRTGESIGDYLQLGDSGNSDPDQISNAIITGNHIYTTASEYMGYPTGASIPPSWDYSGNTAHGLTNPPAWNGTGTRQSYPAKPPGYVTL